MSLGRANNVVAWSVPIHNLFAVMSDGDSTLSNITDKLVPVISDGTPIIWTDDNDAHLEGLPTCVGSFINLNRGQDTRRLGFLYRIAGVSYTIRILMYSETLQGPKRNGQRWGFRW